MLGTGTTIVERHWVVTWMISVALLYFPRLGPGITAIERAKMRQQFQALHLNKFVSTSRITTVISY